VIRLINGQPETWGNAIRPEGSLSPEAQARFEARTAAWRMAPICAHCGATIDNWAQCYSCGGTERAK